MAAPILLLVFNITLYLFPVLAYRFKRAFGYYFKFRPLIHIPAIAFMLGAIFSTLNSVNIQSSMQVLPNYLYWGILIIFLSSHARNLNFDVIAKASFWGVVIITVYYYAQHNLPDLPILGSATPNGYAFNMISFTPLAVQYLNNQREKRYALLLLILLALVQLSEGRRAGFVLVLMGGLLTLYFPKLKLRQLLVALIGTVAVAGAMSSRIVENFLLKSNERIYNMLYKTEEVRRTDESYLVRVAMIKKGKSIYEERPYTGIGLNNFTKYKAEISADFEGANIALRKKDINKTGAHNSYISILAEGGLVVFIPFLMILFFSILSAVLNYNRLPKFGQAVFFGTIMMAIHLYFISALMNVFAWFLLGLCASLIYHR